MSKAVGVEPQIGIRARLLSKGAGKWAESGGENAKFGLSTTELLAAVELLQREGRWPKQARTAAPTRSTKPQHQEALAA